MGAAKDAWRQRMEPVLKTGAAAIAEHGWEDCNLWVIFDHEMSQQPVRPELKVMLDQIRQMVPNDTRTDLDVHRLVAWALSEFERIDNAFPTR